MVAVAVVVVVGLVGLLVGVAVVVGEVVVVRVVGELVVVAVVVVAV